MIRAMEGTAKMFFLRRCCNIFRIQFRNIFINCSDLGYSASSSPVIIKFLSYFMSLYRDKFPGKSVASSLRYLSAVLFPLPSRFRSCLTLLLRPFFIITYIFR
uniref:Secreted protein n=1 Tax=Steinernema glaseri TaxID=37863 RepID=A0A1I7ZZJ2_9BILA